MIIVKTPVMAPTLNGFSAVKELCENLSVRQQVSYFICATNHRNISPTKLRLGDVEKYKNVMRHAPCAKGRRAYRISTARYP